MRKLLICLMFLAPLAGCVSILPKKSAPAAPAWVLAAPADSREWFWGVGEGPDLDAAKRGALKDIAARLRVSISGQLDSQMTVTNNQVDRQSRSRIYEEVQKTEFSNYVIDKTAQSENGFFVLAKVDRQAFIRDLKNKLGNVNGRIQPISATLDTKTPLERFVALRRIQPDLDQATGYAQLLIGAEPGGEGSGHLRNYESLQQRSREALAGLVFEIQTRIDDQDLAAAMTAYLNENGIRTELNRSGDGNILSMTSSTQSDVLYGSKLVKLNILLNVKDDQGRTLASRDYTVTGASSYDHRAARQNALQKWINGMREAGPVTGLGFSE